VRVEGVSWVGVRTEQYAAMASFFRDVVGLEAVLEQHDFLVFRMPGGDQVEIFGPDGPNPAEQFAHGEVVAGLLVDDFEAATEELRLAGIELIGDRHAARAATPGSTFVPRTARCSNSATTRNTIVHSDSDDAA
jgi:Glyoxalase/Bleomycin resistance protein/Dioxygenase superfamily